MSAFTGTWRLVRLALRRDRIKLPLWVVAIVGMVAVTIPAVTELYGADQEDRLTYAATTASSIITRVFSGPIAGPDIGAIVLNESYLFVVVMAAFMSTLAVVRHTRQNEETGRAELIGSSIVGRYALLTAALIVVVATNLVMGVLLALTLASELPLAGSIGAAAGVAATGIVFAGMAAITAQLSQSARGANGLAAAAIGVAFLTRGVGDGIGSIGPNGMTVTAAWPSFFSPMAWGQQVFPYTLQRWGWFIPLLALFVGLTAFAFFLTSRRDLGGSFLADKPGKAHAPAALLSPIGLAWRLQRALLRGWAVSIVLFGLMTGLMVKEFRNMLDQNEAFAEVIRQLGGKGDVSQVMIAAMLAMAGLIIGGYVIHALQRMRSEESSGHMEPLLATPVSRQGWMLSHLSVAMLGAVALCVVMGASTGFSYALAIGSAWIEVWNLTCAALAQVPAILVVAGFVALTFGVVPRMTIGLSWAAYAGCVVVMQLGAMLSLPQWVMNLSPFTHAPGAPTETVTAQPILTLLAVAFGLILLGLAAFRRRDVATA